MLWKMREVTNDTACSEHGVFYTWLDPELSGGKRGEVGGEIPLACLPLQLLAPFPSYRSCQVLGESFLTAATSPQPTSGLRQEWMWSLLLPQRWKAHSGLLGAKPHRLFSLLDTTDHTLFVETPLSRDLFAATLRVFLLLTLSFISVSSEGFSFSTCLFMKMSLSGFHLGVSLLAVSHSLLLLFTFQWLPNWCLYSKSLILA